MEYNLSLGQLVSVWTPHVSNAESSSIVLPYSNLVTSIFPERDSTCYFKIEDESNNDMLCKMPLGYKEGKQLEGLMTLKSFAEDGCDVINGKILVCVKSLGSRKKSKRIL